MPRMVGAALAGLLLALPLAVPAAAVPVDPDQVVELKQPGGKTLAARPFGDEWNHGLRTSGGYTIVRNRKTKRWEYATKEADGGLKASGVRAGTAPPTGTRKRMRDLDGNARPRTLTRSPRIAATGTRSEFELMLTPSGPAVPVDTVTLLS